MPSNTHFDILASNKRTRDKTGQDKIQNKTCHDWESPPGRALIYQRISMCGVFEGIKTSSSYPDLTVHSNHTNGFIPFTPVLHTEALIHGVRCRLAHMQIHHQSR